MDVRPLFEVEGIDDIVSCVRNADGEFDVDANQALVGVGLNGFYFLQDDAGFKAKDRRGNHIR